MLQASYIPNYKTRQARLNLAKTLGEEFIRNEFGPKAFDDDGGVVGKFWGILETRPVR